MGRVMQFGKVNIGGNIADVEVIYKKQKGVVEQIFSRRTYYVENGINKGMEIETEIQPKTTFSEYTESGYYGWKFEGTCTTDDNKVKIKIPNSLKNIKKIVVELKWSYLEYWPSISGGMGAPSILLVNNSPYEKYESISLTDEIFETKGVISDPMPEIIITVNPGWYDSTGGKAYSGKAAVLIHDLYVVKG